MSDPRNWAISYLAARGDVPWRWADDGDVLVWADGTTIAFRAEIVAVLEWLVPHGWPSFGALVWLLAACRGKLPPPSGLAERVPAPDFPADLADDSSQPSLTSFQERVLWMHVAVEAGLAAISRLPEGLRSSVTAKAVLAEIVFAGRGATDGPASLRSAVAEVLRSGLLTDAMLNDPGAPPPEIRNEWLALYEGLRGVTVDSLTLHLQTGLDELPQPPELPPIAPIASERVRALLADLREDDEHAGLARLTRDFMAALQLPRRLSEPDEMPIGGFADLSNRGNLDRLLLSELAHDDLTLAVRIALNEALYLRREPPAKQPPCTLAMLIDSGVRVWGVPRLLAAAVALALIAKSAKNEELAVFRASGEQLLPVDLLSCEGLIDHLGVLEAGAHPGPALAAFADVVRAQERSEAVLVTHRDVLADADFQRCLAQTDFALLYLAVVERDGSFELLRYPQGGAPLCRAQVEIDDLWAKPKAGSPTPKRQPLIASNPELPLCFSLDPFPLLIAVRGKVQASIHTSGGGGLCVMQDRRLLQWDELGCGARTLAWSLPRGRTLGLNQLDDGRICVVKAYSGCRRLACRLLDSAGQLVGTYEWQFAQPVRRVHFQRDHVFVICLLETTVHSLLTGERLGSLETRNGPSHGIYFRTEGNQWTILAWNGLVLEHVPVLLPMGVPADRVLRVFSRQGFEGPWCLSRDGDIYSHEGRVVLRLGPLQNVVRVSENGHRLLVAEAAGRVTRLVDLPTLSHRVITGVVRDEEWDWKPAPPTHEVKTRFDQIAIGANGDLYLRARNRAWRMLDSVAGPDGKRCLEWTIPESSPTDAVEFQQIILPGGPGFSVKVARWPDGRCAWLDSRGMLHLRGADRAWPEVSLTLSRRAAVWCSDHQYFGPRFFVGDRSRADIEEVWARIEAFGLPVPSFTKST